MAERRMFAKTIIDSDAFLEMPLSSQCLYFHLSMRADDEGFVNNPKKIERMIGSSGDDLKLLIAKRFIIPFESGVCVIKHWKIHNYIQNDRFKETMYQEEKAMLIIKKNKAYTLLQATDTDCIQGVSKMETQVRLGKDSIGKVSEGKNSIGLGTNVPPNVPRNVPKCPDENPPETEIEKELDLELELEKEKELKKKTKKENTPPPEKKTSFAEFVTLTQTEYDTLLTNLESEQAVKECIAILDNYKGSSGKKYKSDYRAILSWVVDKYRAKKKDSSTTLSKSTQAAEEAIRMLKEREL